MKKAVDKALQKLNSEVPTKITDIVRAVVEAEAELAKKLGIPAAPLLGNFAQRTISHGMKVATLEAIEDLRREGRTKDEYLHSAQAHYTLAELMDFLDGEIPDKDKFEILKNILLKAATEEASDVEDIRPQQ